MPSGFIATGLTAPIGRSAAVFNGDVFFGTNVGTLYRSIGGTAAFTLVAAAFGGSATPVNSLYVFNGKLYGNHNLRLLEWDGVSAWVSRGTYITERGGPGRPDMVARDGVLYLQDKTRVYTWDGVNTLTSINVWSPTNGDLAHICLGSDNCIYVGKRNTSGPNAAFLYKYDGAVWTTLVTTGPRTSNEPVYVWHEGAIYLLDQYFSPSDLTLHQYSGGSTWGPILATAPAQVNAAYGAVSYNGRIYFETLSNSGPNAPGYVLSWAVGETSFRLDGVRTSAFGQEMISIWFPFNGKLYATSQNSSTISKLVEFYIPPEVAPTFSILPDSTGKVSHTRVMKGYRNDVGAADFHNAIKGSS